MGVVLKGFAENFIRSGPLRGSALSTRQRVVSSVPSPPSSAPYSYPSLPIFSKIGGGPTGCD